MNEDLLNALIVTGDFLEKYSKEERTGGPVWESKMDQALEQSAIANPWFIREFVLTALKSVSSMMQEDQLQAWINNYPQLEKSTENAGRVGVISAGNIPLVGFHDFLCVLVSGKTFVGKLSSQDNVLLPLIAGFICELYPIILKNIIFKEGKLEGFDRVIATGSNNSARYFEYYFRNYPCLLRKNRNSIAILTGEETDEELVLLGDDIFLYFGLGCRNVSKVFVPRGYDLTQLFPHWTRYAFLEHHNKYHNNYSYYKSIYLVNRDEHLDNGFLLVKKDDTQLVSPVSVLYIEEYPELTILKGKLQLLQDQLQCIVSRPGVYPDSIPFGKAQYPGIMDYADGVDTIEFLLK